MATKKTADQVKAAMAKVEAAKKAEAAKTEVKTEVKAPVAKETEKKAPAKTAAKKAPAKKTETTKTAAKKAPAKKTTTTKTVAKKAPAKKTTVKASETVHIQACGYDVTTQEVVDKVVAIVGKKVKELNIYVKPEDKKIYYTADGNIGSVDL